jgi:hypothetical protein
LVHFGEPFEYNLKKFFNEHLVHFLLFALFKAILVYVTAIRYFIPIFGILRKEKSGNPARDSFEVPSDED